MGHMNFHRGQAFTIGDALYVIQKRVSKKKLIVAERDEMPFTFSDDEIARMIGEEKLHMLPSPNVPENRRELFKTSFDGLTIPQQEEAKRRHAYIEAYWDIYPPLSRSAEGLTEFLKVTAERIGDNCVPGWSTLTNWLRMWEQADRKDLRALAPATGARGNRQPKLAPEVYEIIEGAIREVWLTPKRYNKRMVYNRVVAAIAQWNAASPDNQLKEPSERTVLNHINKVDLYTETRMRFSRAAAKREFHPVQIAPVGTRPLERVVMDHTKMDIIVVDEESRAVFARPTLTTAMDEPTRMVLGFYIGFEPPSASAIMHCLHHAIQYKQGIGELVGDPSADWPCYGVPETIVLDNGREFHGHHFKTAMKQLGCNVVYAPVRSPEFKGKVERWHRTMSSQLAHNMDGTTWSNIKQRGDVNPEKMAIFTMRELKTLFSKWLVQVYHQTPHRGLKDVPYFKWNELNEKFPVAFPPSPSDLAILLGVPVTRSLLRYGIEVNNLTYNSSLVSELRMLPGVQRKRDVELRVNEGDLSGIRVLDPRTGTWEWVPSRQPEYTKGLTLQMHKTILQFARKTIRGKVSIAKLCEIRDELRQIIEEKRASKKKLGSKIARLEQVGTQTDRDWQPKEPKARKLPGKATTEVQPVRNIDDNRRAQLAELAKLNGMEIDE